MKSVFNDKKILITGGSGSFGRAFLNRRKEFKPRLVRIYSRNEYQLFQVKQKFGEGAELVVGDVRDLPRLKQATEGIDFVIHAAALKQIDFCEQNPEEAIKTNVLGTKNVVLAAKEQGVKKVVHLSSDKGVYPTSVYGLTKALADKIFQEGNIGKTVFFSLRYSNIVSSHGSVFEIFLARAKEGKDLQVFSPHMERYLLTQNQILNLLEFAFPLAKGGEIFFPLPPKVKILDLAQKIAKSHQVTVKVINKTREGEKESAFLVNEEEMNRLYKLKKNWFVVSPKKTKGRRGEIISRYISSEELDKLIKEGEKEICL